MKKSRKPRQSQPSSAELASRFEKGRPKTGGRKKGTLNEATLAKGIERFTLEVMKFTLNAMELAGDADGKNGAVGFLAWLFRKHPKLFASLVLGLLPKNIEVKAPAESEERPSEAPIPSLDEVREMFRSMGLAVPDAFPLVDFPRVDRGDSGGEEPVKN
jgi:hypothetical protein